MNPVLALINAIWLGEAWIYIVVMLIVVLIAFVRFYTLMIIMWQESRKEGDELSIRGRHHRRLTFIYIVVAVFIYVAWNH